MSQLPRQAVQPGLRTKESHVVAPLKHQETLAASGLGTGAGPRGSRLTATLSRSRWVFAICLAVVLTLQVLTGSYRVERGIYSDDAPHFMNGLVIRDYLWTGLGQNPLAFAETYYLNYPKIAPLMWPPLFHVTLGLVLLPGWPPGAAALVLVALTAAWLVWRLYEMVRRLVGPRAAWLAAAFLVTTPLVQSLSGVVMLDVAIAALSLEAVYWLARYAQSSSRRDAMLFGMFTAAACLTKGNGVAVVLTPVVFILITGRWDLLRRSGLYLAALIVIVFAVPLLAMSASFDAAIGDFGPVTARLVLERIEFFSHQLWTQVGPPIVVLALTGLVIVIRRGRGRGSANFTLPFEQALAALAIASVVFHVLSPHRISVGRYMTMTVAPLIGLAFVAAGSIIDRVHIVEWRPAARFTIAAVMVLAAVLVRPALPIRQPLGFRAAIASLSAAGELAGRRLLVVSDETGEGAFVTEAAVLGLNPVPTIIRGSKLLASDDWNGHDFALRYQSAEALLTDLEALHVAYVLLDHSAESAALPYYKQIQELAATEPVRFARMSSSPRQSTTPYARSLELYRVTSPTAGPAKPLQVPVQSLGRPLSR